MWWRRGGLVQIDLTYLFLCHRRKKKSKRVSSHVLSGNACRIVALEKILQ